MKGKFFMNKSHKNISTIIISFMVALIFISSAYALLNQNINILIKASINSSEEEDFYSITDTWYNGSRYYYNMNISIKNTKPVQTTGWKISFDVPSDVTSLENSWNAEYTIENNRVIFEPAAHNPVILPDGETSFGFILSTALDSDYTPTNAVIELYTEPYDPDNPNPNTPDPDDPNNPDEPDPDNPDNPDPPGPIIPGESDSKVEAELTKSNSWGDAQSGFMAQYSLVIKNTSEAPISSWYVVMEDFSKCTLLNLWGTDYEEVQNYVIVKNDAYNGTIQPGNSVQISFQIKYTDVDFELQLAYSGENNPMEQVNTLSNDLNNAGAEVSFNINGYEPLSDGKYKIYYNVTLKNTNEYDITKWRIEISDLDNFTLNNIYNANYVLNDSVLAITSTNSGQVISKNQSANFQMELIADNQNYIPTVRYIGCE